MCVLLSVCIIMCVYVCMRMSVWYHLLSTIVCISSVCASRVDGVTTICRLSKFLYLFLKKIPIFVGLFCQTALILLGAYSSLPPHRSILCVYLCVSVCGLCVRSVCLSVHYLS